MALATLGAACGGVEDDSASDRADEDGACGDGSVALCEIVPPKCPAGTIVEIVDGCFGECVDPETCEPPDPVTVAGVKMYDEPDPDVDPDCDLHHELAVFRSQTTPGMNGTLIAKLDGSCELPVPEERLFFSLFTHPAPDSCGARTANFGAVRLDRDGKPVADDNGKPIVMEGRYVDNRENTCEIPIPALFVIRIDDPELGQRMFFGNLAR